MILLEPEARVRDKERHHFPPSEIVDTRAPNRMEPLPRIGVLVEMRAVKARKPVRVIREMGGNPIEQHANTSRVRRLDEFGKLLGRAEAAGWRIKRDRLI